MENTNDESAAKIEYQDDIASSQKRSSNIRADLHFQRQRVCRRAIHRQHCDSGIFIESADDQVIGYCWRWMFMRSKTLMTASTYKKSSSCSQGVHLEIQTPQMKRLDSWSPSLASCSLSSARPLSMTGRGRRKKFG